MDTSTPSRPDALFDRDVNALAAALFADTSSADVPIWADLAVEAAVLLREADVHRIPAGYVADILELADVRAGRCMVSPALCQAAAFLFGEIAETSLPQARCAEQLAEVFKAKLIGEP